MLTARIIPCLDVSNGVVVKGINFKNLRNVGSPPDLAALYEAQGADELVFLDISATPEGRSNQKEMVKEVRDVLSIPMTVGGGIRSADDAQVLLEAGADKVAVNTAAVENPEILSEMASRFGRQCTILALDAARKEDSEGFEVVVYSGKKRTGIDALEWAKEAEARGAGEILLTSFDKDGTRSGYDLELLKAISAVVNIPIIASGGAANPGHLVEALDAGASAVLAASIFHDSDYTVATVKEHLAEQSVSVRL